MSTAKAELKAPTGIPRMRKIAMPGFSARKQET
jgi:hypothetical protein